MVVSGEYPTGNLHSAAVVRTPSMMPMLNCVGSRPAVQLMLTACGMFPVRLKKRYNDGRSRALRMSPVRQLVERFPSFNIQMGERESGTMRISTLVLAKLRLFASRSATSSIAMRTPQPYAADSSGPMRRAAICEAD